MINEMRYYITTMLEALKEEAATFVPSYLVTAVKLPTGAIELAVNTTGITEKLEYILSAYNDEMCLKTNEAISMCQLMIV